MIYEREERPLKEVYSDLLVEYGRKDPRIVIVEADLMKSGSTDKFQQEFPDRTFDVGVAEANMICVAAGLSLMGKIPFTHTFAVFASRRCCDQINQSVAYAGCNVKMCGSDPGITTELNGGTHMAMDDVGIMRSIPEMTIFVPCFMYFSANSPCLPKATQLIKSASCSPSLRNLLFTAKVYLATHVAFSP